MAATVWGDGTPSEAFEIPPAEIINEQAGNYVILTTDTQKIIDYIGVGNATFTLPASVFAGNGFVTTIRNRSAAGVLTVVPSGADTVESAASLAVQAGGAIQLILKDTNFGLTFSRGSSQAPILSTTATVSIGHSPGVGAGGTVTQLTNINTSVTLNKPCGVINTVSFAAVAGTVYEFTLFNNLLQAGDLVVVGGNSFVNGKLRAANSVAFDGSAVISLYCIASITQANTFRFAIIRTPST